MPASDLGTRADRTVVPAAGWSRRRSPRGGSLSREITALVDSSKKVPSTISIAANMTATAALTPPMMRPELLWRSMNRCACPLPIRVGWFVASARRRRSARPRAISHRTSAAAIK